MQIPLKNSSGKVVREIVVSDGLFGLPLTSNLRGVIHQAVTRQRANSRSGTASTKTRAQVVGSTRKLFPQKGTGRARAGSIKSPLRRGGGRTFGPHPRSYRQRMPKKMRRLAIRGALSFKVADGRLTVVDNLGIKEPRTKEMVKVLTALGLKSSALVVTPETQESAVKSARNLQRVKTLPARYLNVLDLLTYDLLVMELGAVRKAEELWAPEGPPPEDPQEEAKPAAKKREKKPRKTKTLADTLEKDLVASEKKERKPRKAKILDDTLEKGQATSEKKERKPAAPRKRAARKPKVEEKT
ncbi:MAG: 50S ribosomal protein L4 [Dehalococcoidia bacterium]